MNPVGPNLCKNVSNEILELQFKAAINIETKRIRGNQSNKKFFTRAQPLCLIRGQLHMSHVHSAPEFNESRVQVLLRNTSLEFSPQQELQLGSIRRNRFVLISDIDRM